MAIAALALAATASGVALRLTDALPPRPAGEFGVTLGEASPGSVHPKATGANAAPADRRQPSVPVAAAFSAATGRRPSRRAAPTTARIDAVTVLASRAAPKRVPATPGAAASTIAIACASEPPPMLCST